MPPMGRLIRWTLGLHMDFRGSAAPCMPARKIISNARTVTNAPVTQGLQPPATCHQPLSLWWLLEVAGGCRAPSNGCQVVW